MAIACGAIAAFEGARAARQDLFGWLFKRKRAVEAAPAAIGDEGEPSP